MRRNSENNRETLIKEVIDGMDLEALIEVVRDHLDRYYGSLSHREFTKEWKEVFDEE
jgi:hypothetical protein